MVAYWYACFSLLGVITEWSIDLAGHDEGACTKTKEAEIKRSLNGHTVTFPALALCVRSEFACVWLVIRETDTHTNTHLPLKLVSSEHPESRSRPKSSQIWVVSAHCTQKHNSWEWDKELLSDVPLISFSAIASFTPLMPLPPPFPHFPCGCALAQPEFGLLSERSLPGTVQRLRHSLPLALLNLVLFLCKQSIYDHIGHLGRRNHCM